MGHFIKRGWFFFFLCACVCGDRKWVGANDKWKRSAPFISPASGVKWGTGCNHSRCFRGVVLVLQCFFLQSASRRGATTFVWKRFSGIIQKHHLFQSYHLDPQPNKQILRQRAFLFLIVSAPPPPSHASRGTEYQSDAVHRFQGENPPKEAFKKLLIKTVERGGAAKKKNNRKGGREKKKKKDGITGCTERRKNKEYTVVWKASRGIANHAEKRHR